MDLEAMQQRMIQLRHNLDKIDEIFSDPEKHKTTKEHVVWARSTCIANIQQQQIATFNRE